MGCITLKNIHIIHRMTGKTSVLVLVILSALWYQKAFGFSQNSSQGRGGGGTRRQPVKTTLDPSLHDKRFKEKTVVLLYNKPANVVTSHVSEDSRSTVYNEILSMQGFIASTNPFRADMTGSTDRVTFEQATGIRTKLHAIGRLDVDTTGLLLLTNDGGLVHHVTNHNACTTTGTQDDTGTASSRPITKTYEALIMGYHDETSLQSLWEGVNIGSKYGGMTRPVDDLRILDHPNHKSTLVSITISEGKNRQVRRMFHSLGSGVMKLKRTRIGQHLTLHGVEENQWRILSHQEVYEFLGWEARELTTTRNEFPNNLSRRNDLLPHRTKHNRTNSRRQKNKR